MGIPYAGTLFEGCSEPDRMRCDQRAPRACSLMSACGAVRSAMGSGSKSHIRSTASASGPWHRAAIAAAKASPPGICWQCPNRIARLVNASAMEMRYCFTECGQGFLQQFGRAPRGYVARCRAGLKKLWLICWLQLHPLEYRVSQQQPPTAAFQSESMNRKR